MLTLLILLSVSFAPFVSAAHTHLNMDAASDTDALLSSDTVFYSKCHGLMHYKEAYEKTAIYQAVQQSELMPLLEKVIDFAANRIPREEFSLIKRLGKNLEQEGIILAISLPKDPNQPPLPQATVVIPQGGDLAVDIHNMLQKYIERDLEFKTEQINERTVFTAVIPNSPGVEISFWKEAEGNQLVIVAGIGAARKTIGIKMGKLPNITTNATWKELQGKKSDFTLNSESWIDFETILQVVGRFPIPNDHGDAENVTVNEILQIIGLDTLKRYSMQSGYEGKAVCSTSDVVTTDNPQGIFKPTVTKPFQLSDLPPFPVDTMTFNATSINLGEFHLTMAKIVQSLVDKLGNKRDQKDVANFLDNLEHGLLPNLTEDLLNALGDTICLYHDPDNGIFGTGFSIAIQVKDAAKLEAALKTISEKLSEGRLAPFQMFPKKLHGHDVYVLEFSGPHSRLTFQCGALGHDDKWLILGMMPQGVTGYFLRQQGKLPSWKPSAEAAAVFAELPQNMHSVSYADLRQGYRHLLSLGYALFPMLQSSIYQSGLLSEQEQLPFHLEDLPPAELVTAPLFPTVTVVTVEDNVYHTFSRGSICGVPLLSKVGSINAETLGASAVIAGLLLPAVQDSRYAARRSQSRNNLKLQLLSIHNYHDTFDNLPLATVPNDELKPDERLSWMIETLPFMEQIAVSEKINKKEKWNSPANSTLTKVVIPLNLNPSYERKLSPDGYGVTNYVGVAGVGENAIDSVKIDSHSGIFNQSRVTKFKDVKDGLSNTLLMMEVTEKSSGPWAQGGNSTVRAFTKKPYINGPDGFGGAESSGFNAAMADGSVRFFTSNINPELLERLATIADGKAVGDF
jgi:hypothetical protein